MNEYMLLLRLEDIRKMLGIIIVECFDEKYGFSDNAIKEIVRCKCELDEVVRLLDKERWG